jgi:hypothetical protein
MKAIPFERVRMLPFAALATFSLWYAYQAPRRKPFGLDLDLSATALATAMTKVPHYCASALVFSLAALAVGRRRLPLALGLTMIVGFGWELAEATGRGHHACLADLAPDLTSALACLIVTAALPRAR